MLGSSDYGAQVAAHFGLPYAFAWFFTDGKGGPEALDLYRQLYQPSARHPEPHTALCVWALAAETEEEARFQFLSRARVRLLRDTRPISCPWSHRRSPPHSPIRPRSSTASTGCARTPSSAPVPRWRSASDELAARLNVQEMAVVTWAYDEAVRHTSYRLLAEAMGLAQGG